MFAGGLLTKKQKEVLDFVQSFTKEHGYGPSLKEIQKAMEFTSHSTAQFHINQLAEKGFFLTYISMQIKRRSDTYFRLPAAWIH